MRKLLLACAVAALTLAAATHAANAAPADSAAADTSGTRVVMLGTGTPNADPTARARVWRWWRVAGPTCGLRSRVVRRAAAAQRAGVAALMPESLSIVFITHLHSDHTAGLPDLILTPWVLERSRPLAVYGPPACAR